MKMDEASQALLAAARTYAVEHGKEQEGAFRAEEFLRVLEPVFVRAGMRGPLRRVRQRILIVRDDAAGDFVLFSPVLREVRRLYPAAEIVLLVSPRNGALAAACPYVDAVSMVRFTYGPGQFWLAFQQAAEFAADELLQYGFDLAFCPRLGIRSVSLLLAYFSGAKERVGFTQDRQTPEGVVVPTGWDALLTHAAPFPMVKMHEVDRDLSLLESMIRLPVTDRRLEVWYTPAEAREARERLAVLRTRGFHRLYAVVPGASIAMKCWPAARYAELLRGILQSEPEVGIVVLGGPGDREAAAELAAVFGERALSFAGEVSFRVSAAMMAECVLYIGNDTGLLHIAAAEELPVLSVCCFPASLGLQPLSIPVRFAPYRVPSVVCQPGEPRNDCRDAWRHGCSREREAHCILGVSVELMRRGYVMLRQIVAEGRNVSILLH